MRFHAKLAAEVFHWMPEGAPTAYNEGRMA